MGRLAIFPASGKLGTSICAHLFNLIKDPADLILISRFPEKTPSKYLEAGVKTRTADYDSPESLEGVFDDVSCLLLISYPSIEYEHRFEAHKHAITTAIHSHPGISQIFYTSLAFGGASTPNSVAHVVRAHLATESFLKSLTTSPSSPAPPKPIQLTFTAIREGIYSESFPMYTGFFSLTSPQQEVKLPQHDGSGPGIAWAKIDELGEATARLVNDYVEFPNGFEYENQGVLLSGPREWSIADTLKVAGKAVGTEVRIKMVGIEEYVNEPIVREMLGEHGPGEVPRQWATAFEAVREGETAAVSGELERLLGREPEGFEVTVRAMAKAKD